MTSYQAVDQPDHAGGLDPPRGGTTSSSCSHAMHWLLTSHIEQESLPADRHVATTPITDGPEHNPEVGVVRHLAGSFEQRLHLDHLRLNAACKLHSRYIRQ